MQIIQKRFPMIYFVTMHKELFRLLFGGSSAGTWVEGFFSRGTRKATPDGSIRSLSSDIAIVRLFLIGPNLTPVEWFRDMSSGDLVINCAKGNCD